MANPEPPAASPARCQNCAAELHGPFCHACGQKDFDFRRSFGSVASELLETFLNFDGKLLRGMHTLLFRPGRLTAEFLAGKRTSQVPPLRFYIFVSVIYFLADAFSGGGALRVAENVDTRTRQDAGFKAAAAQHSSIEQTLRRGLRNKDEINRMFRESLPTLFLCGVPVLAAFNWMLFRRGRLTYLQHLVAAVHLQTFALLLGMCASGWGRLVGYAFSPGYQTVRIVAFAYFLGATFVALRRVYGETAWGTVWRGVVLLNLYFWSLMLGMSLLVIAAFLQM